MQDAVLKCGFGTRLRIARSHRSKTGKVRQYLPTQDTPLLVERFRSSNHMLVIPGRREAASPESITTGRGLWIPGSPPSVAPRNDQAEHMIGFIESVH